MNLKLFKKGVYGRMLHYPDCPRSELFCQMMNCKTIQPFRITQLRRLGFAIEILDEESQKLELLHPIGSDGVEIIGDDLVGLKKCET